MNGFVQFVEDHQTVAALVAAWLGSNVVSALPSPDSGSGKFYKFTFSLFHGLAGSLPRLLPSLRMPGDTSRNTVPFFASEAAPSQTPPPTPPAA